MKQYWQNFCEWFDARNERERILITAVLVVSIISLWVVLISDPQNLQRQQLLATQSNLDTQQKAAQAQIDAIKARAKIDPDKTNKQKIAQLVTSISGINEQLQKKMRGFVAPERMASVLEDVLKQNSKLTLVKFESLPAEYIFADVKQQKNKQKEADKAGLYRHGFKIELQGSYLNTLSYLKSLEDLAWDFYWDGIEIEIVKYPQAKIVLQLHTLSLKESWIGV